MAKRFSLEFKRQAIKHALARSHEPLAVIAKDLDVGYSTLDKWMRQASETGSSKRQLSSEPQRILELEKN